jgi:short-subunit dehydrogenase
MNKAIIMGASSGIGMETAKLLIRDGWTVGLAARREERLISIRQEMQTELKQNQFIFIAKIDITQTDAGAKLKQLITEMGGMDLYLHVSGIGKQNRTLESGIELHTIETNGLGFTRMVGEAYRYFSTIKHGHIACITSIAGTKGLGPAPSYSATKAMQNVYIQALEQQALSNKIPIKFTDIRPGFVDTDLLSGSFRYPLMLKPQAVARQIVKAIYKGKHVYTIDWKWRIITAGWRWIPNCVWRSIKL